MTLSAGTRLGPYEVLAPLGAGGMGEVYRARDKKLDRDVAIKVLPQSVATDPDRLARFEREAKAVASLSHPNILAIHDFGTHDGVVYAVMELLEGETLREKLRAPISQTQAVDYALQIAKGLSAAHEKGVIHRDLKPENLFVTKDGHLKILDFGLAKKIEAVTPGEETSAPTVSGHTEPGTVMGTVGYMSPEQVRGLPVDHRSDIFSFGTILHELLSGKRAFKGGTAAETMAAIMRDDPPELSESGRNISTTLDHVVRHCLEKDRDRRFQSARDIAFALSEVTGPTVSSGAPTARLPGERRILIAAAVAVGLAVAALSYFLWRDKRVAAGPIQSLAVLPLQNLSGDPDQEYLADGITEELITDLAKIGSLRVISRTSAMHYKGSTETLPQVGRELNVDAVVQGSVRGSGQRVRIAAQLIRAATDQHIWAEEYERDSRDVLVMEEEVARDITREVGVRLPREARALLQGARPVDPEAHEAYLRGRFYWYKRTEKDLKKALQYFQQAIEKEPNYAAAYDGLADCYVNLTEYGALSTSEAGPRAEAAARKALEIDPSLAEAHATLGELRDSLYRDWRGAEQEYKRAIELNPNFETGHDWYSFYLAEMGRTAEAIAEGRRALEVDPLSPRASCVVCWQFYFAHRYGEAIAQARKTLELDANYMPAYWCSGVAYEKKADFKEAIAKLQRAVTLSGGSTEIQAWLGYTYAVAGKRDEALSILQDLKNRSKREYVAPNRFAEIYTGLGDKDQAFEWWNKARDEHNDLIYLTVWPATESLRSDPRYTELLQGIGLRR